ncbi:MAG: DnaJ C-terminal domain-containing protein [Alphaproteobacteria bacterium]|nr:DnaJ C-terminal domain-containing protein [Alphaproteobacteria bacterium]
MASLYDTLGIAKGAGDAEIKKAYHKMARKLHPDVNPDKKASEQFKKVSGAYDILSDKAKRARYDAGEIDDNGNPTPFGGGAYDRGGQGFGGFHPGAGGAQYRTRNINPEEFAQMFGGAGFDFADLFGGMGGARRGGQSPFGRASYGQDVQYEYEIPFDLSITGGETTIVLANGRKVKMKIPAGVVDGAVLRLRNQGDSGGDALIRIGIQKSALFTRDGDNVLATIPLTLKEAVLGAKITIPTPFGPVAMRVPPYTGGGTTLRLKGKGVAGRGDLLVRFNITLPAASDGALDRFMNNWDEPTRNPRR